MAVNFYIESRLDKHGDAQIRVSLAITGARYVTSTGIKIDPDKWDSKNKRAKKGASNSSGMTWARINAALKRIEEHFGNVEADCLVNQRTVDNAFLKREFNAVFRANDKTSAPARENAATDTETPSLGFWDCYSMFTTERGASHEWTRATFQKFNALKRHIDDWNKNVSFDTFTESGLNEFVGFLRDDLEMKNTTIGKQLGYLKWFLRWATLKGFNSNLTYQAFAPKLKTAKNVVVFLEWDELMKVMNYDVPANGTVITLTDSNGKQYDKTVHDTAGIEKARDIFCFCCFTSLRYSDANNLKKSNIVNNQITITTIKTADTITVELNKYALAILERYRDVDLGEYALPRMTNQRMNIYLKDLCELCGINQPVTRTYYRGTERIDETLPKYELIGTHTGRRTFICNALGMGIPAEIIMKWTGHADYKSMAPYIEIMNSAKKDAMKLWDKK